MEYFEWVTMDLTRQHASIYFVYKPLTSTQLETVLMIAMKWDAVFTCSKSWYISSVSFLAI